MSRETHKRFLKRLEKAASERRNTVVGECAGCGVGLLPRALAVGAAVRIGPDSYLCNTCEGGEQTP